MSEEFKSGTFRKVKVGYSPVRWGGEALVPKDAKVIGYLKETMGGIVREYVIHVLEEKE